MNSITSSHQKPSSFGANYFIVAGIAAAVLVEQPISTVWPKVESPIYDSSQQCPSFSSISRIPTEIDDEETVFVNKIIDFYKNLSDRQVPLGREIEEIWDKYAVELYHS